MFDFGVQTNLDHFFFWSFYRSFILWISQYHTGGNFEGFWSQNIFRARVRCVIWRFVFASRYHLFQRNAPFTFRNGEQIPEPRTYVCHEFLFLKVESESDESWAFFVPCNNSIQLIETYAILVRLQVAYETWGHLVDLAVCVETWPMGTWKGDNLASQSASPSQSLSIFLPNNLRRMPSETMQFYYSGSLWFYGFWDLELSSNTRKTDRKHLQVWHVSILPCVLSFPESCTWMVGTVRLSRRKRNWASQRQRLRYIIIYHTSICDAAIQPGGEPFNVAKLLQVRMALASQIVLCFSSPLCC